MNSTKMTGKDKQNHIFQKGKSNEISRTVVYIGEVHEFIINVLYQCIPLDNEIYTKCNKTSNLNKGISSHNICSGIKRQEVIKTIQYQKPLIFLRIYLPFHRVTFDHSISCVLLIDKTKLPKLKKIKEMPCPPQKKFKKKRKQYYTSKDKCRNFTKFFRRPKNYNSNISNEKQRT